MTNYTLYQIYGACLVAIGLGVSIVAFDSSPVLFSAFGFIQGFIGFGMMFSIGER